jgi:multiple sugar transport system substrate-binding protein
VTIEVLTRPGITNPTGHSQHYSKITTQRFTPQTNITVNLVDANPNTTEAVLLRHASGTLPDAAWLGVNTDGLGGRKAAGGGAYRPLDDLIRTDKLDTSAYWKSALEVLRVGGKLYALPTHGHYGSNILYYNASLTKPAGITVPPEGTGTLDQMIEAARRLTRPADDVWGWWPNPALPDYLVTYLRTFGGALLDAAGKRCLLDTPESRAAIQWIYDAQVKFQTINDLYRSEGGRNLFQAGKLALWNFNVARIADYRQPGQQVIRHELGTAMFPKGPTGRRGSELTTAGMGITSPAKEAAAWQWIKFITSKDVGVIGVTENAAGSPGARTDVWTDPRLLALDPVFGATAKLFPQGPEAMDLAANHRLAEVNSIVTEELRRVYRGEASVTQATTSAVQRINAVLAMP